VAGAYTSRDPHCGQGNWVPLRAGGADATPSLTPRMLAVDPHGVDPALGQVKGT